MPTPCKLGHSDNYDGENEDDGNDNGAPQPATPSAPPLQHHPNQYQLATSTHTTTGNTTTALAEELPPPLPLPLPLAASTTNTHHNDNYLLLLLLPRRRVHGASFAMDTILT